MVDRVLRLNLVSPASGSSGGSTATDFLLGHYLRDPWRVTQSLLARLQHMVLEWWPLAAPVLMVAVVSVIWGRVSWRRRCRRQLAAEARVVQVLPPPTVAAEGAAALWANLVGLCQQPPSVAGHRGNAQQQPCLCARLVYGVLWVFHGQPLEAAAHLLQYLRHLLRLGERHVPGHEFFATPGEGGE
ncbi:hypothetical protein HCC61_11475 [Streptomyces sp. HNM0575]|uniref:hypothetical protein n=1 Tax=Streptomyces sp. HNM0575 TaxID=2716338 RepID=UPI00145DB61B|nr:hypothetical protein [Streptomyces sp. HNM0575]NLU73291.1 hypothetical protein [Streptomyces sp. HNM0575]